MTGQSPPPQGPAGFASTLSRIASTTLRLIGTRFDQAVVELQLEMHNAVAGLLWGAALVAAALLSLGFLGLTVVLLFKDTHPQAAALGVAAVFALLAVVAGLRLRHAMRSQGSGLASVREELAADLEALDRHRQGPPP